MTEPEARPLVSDLVAALADALPFAWAEPWDRVGLAAGDPHSPVRRVLVSLDPTRAAVSRAALAGANVLLTHHPAYLDPPAPIVHGAGPGGVVFDALTQDVALIACHTNLDRAPAGADALPAAVGLRVLGPLEHSRQPMVSLVTYVPAEAVDAVLAALADAGAGRIGAYEGCAWVGEGEGRFTPRPGAVPYAGDSDADGAVHAYEQRIEAVCDPGRAAEAISAVRAAHPYEEPVILTADAAIERGAARMGRLCEPAAPLTLVELATAVGAALGVTPRVYGEEDRPVRLVATAPGSGRSLVDEALRAGADVLLTGELRYHEALEAATSGLAILEAGHDATEWPMVPVLADIARAVPGLPPGDVIVEGPAAAWWTP